MNVSIKKHWRKVRNNAFPDIAQKEIGDIFCHLNLGSSLSLVVLIAVPVHWVDDHRGIVRV